MPPSPHKDACSIVSQSSSTSAKLPSGLTPRAMFPSASAPRTDPMRQGGPLPQDSGAREPPRAAGAPADRAGADRPAARGTAPIVVQQFTHRQAESALDEPAAAHIAGQLQR